MQEQKTIDVATLELPAKICVADVAQIERRPFVVGDEYEAILVNHACLSSISSVVVCDGYGDGCAVKLLWFPSGRGVDGFWHNEYLCIRIELRLFLPDGTEIVEMPKGAKD